MTMYSYIVRISRHWFTVPHALARRRISYRSEHFRAPLRRPPTATKALYQQLAIYVIKSAQRTEAASVFNCIEVYHDLRLPCAQRQRASQDSCPHVHQTIQGTLASPAIRLSGTTAPWNRSTSMRHAQDH